MVATAVMNLKGGPGKTMVANGLAHASAERAEQAAAALAQQAADAKTPVARPSRHLCSRPPRRPLAPLMRRC